MEIVNQIKSFKIVVLGPMESGKTALISQYVNNYFPEKYKPTEDETSEFLKTVRVAHQEECDQYNQGHVIIKI